MLTKKNNYSLDEAVKILDDITYYSVCVPEDIQKRYDKFSNKYKKKPESVFRKDFPNGRETL